MSEKTPKILMEIRKENKLTRKELYNISGFKERTILSYEKGDRQASQEYIRFISLYFNVSEDYIKGVSDDSYMDSFIRYFEMYKDIYPQNANKVNELFLKYQLDYKEGLDVAIIEGFDELNSSSLDSFMSIIEELNIDVSTFYPYWRKTFAQNQHTEKLKKKYPKAFNEQEIEDNCIFISGEYYASVIKKRNEPELYIPKEDDSVVLNEKYKEIISLLPFVPDDIIDYLTMRFKEYQKTNNDIKTIV